MKIYVHNVPLLNPSRYNYASKTIWYCNTFFLNVFFKSKMAAIHMMTSIIISTFLQNIPKNMGILHF